MTTPDWVLTIVYWFHMLATVVWIGSLVVLSLLILPAARKNLDPHTFTSFFAEIQRRLDPVSWFSLLVLAGAGMVQMSYSTTRVFSALSEYGPPATSKHVRKNL